MKKLKDLLVKDRQQLFFFFLNYAKKSSSDGTPAHQAQEGPRFSNSGQSDVTLSNSCSVVGVKRYVQWQWQLMRKLIR